VAETIALAIILEKDKMVCKLVKQMVKKTHSHEAVPLSKRLHLHENSQDHKDCIHAQSGPQRLYTSTISTQI
jgi:hypothetical protein